MITEIERDMKRFLGKPNRTFNSFDEMLSYYIYAHEFSWGNFGWDLKFEELKEVLTDKYNEYFYKKTIDSEKMWHLMSLVILKHTAKSAEYVFAVNTIDYLIKSQEQLTVDELREYSSKIAYTYFKEGTPFPLPIPTLTKKFDTSIMELVPHFDKLLDLIPKIKTVIVQLIEKDEIKLNDYLKIVKDDYKFKLEYTTFSDYFVELFVSYSSSSLIIYEDEVDILDLTALYESSVVSFLKRIMKKYEKNSEFERQLIDIGNKYFND